LPADADSGVDFLSESMAATQAPQPRYYASIDPQIMGKSRID
jgi:hypothetical protein